MAYCVPMAVATDPAGLARKMLYLYKFFSLITERSTDSTPPKLTSKSPGMIDPSYTMETSNELPEFVLNLIVSGNILYLWHHPNLSAARNRSVIP